MINKDFIVKINESEKLLNNWIANNGLAGYDPFDLYSQVPHFRKILYSKNIFIQYTISRFYAALNKFAPLILRQFFRVQKTINSKGIALLALGYLYRYQRTSDGKDKNKIFELSRWLIENKSKNYPGLSWGYPFDWQSRIFIPEGTPSIVVSWTAGDFFLKAYEYFEVNNYLDIADGICDFILTGLKKTKIDSETICFSYTPIDDFQVHNANLFGAEFLVRVGKIIKNEKYIDTGLKAANFAIKEQLPDGSLNYWGSAQNDQPNNMNDHYHVGFEIRCLMSIGKLTGNQKIIKAADKYYKYYLNNFFENKNSQLVPKMFPHYTYPLDIHACAESIILNTFIYETNQNLNALELAVNTANWVVENMQNLDGSYAASKYKLIGRFWNIKIPYMRWGQAWMHYALNYLLFNLNNSKEK